MSDTILLLSGPNLNLLGEREPEIYGTTTLADLVELATKTAAEHGYDLEHVQSNHEGELVDWIQQGGRDQQAGQLVGAVINAGALTHTSVALPDAIAGAQLRAVEVHISNIHRREPFRQHSYLSSVAAGIVVGFGVAGYPLALRGLHALI